MKNFLPRDIISLLDLTLLEDNLSAPQISELCQRACTPLGNVAAICIPLANIKQAKTETTIPIATVVNFPQGTASLTEVKHEIAMAADADEIDIVFPYIAFQQNDPSVADFIKTCRTLTQSKILKIILETGAFTDNQLLYNAAQLCIHAKVDFLKTSTGKIKTGATLAAVNILLSAIKDSHTQTGLKISGGVRTVPEAQAYIQLTQEVLSADFIQPKTFRFGASQLLTGALEWP